MSALPISAIETVRLEVCRADFVRYAVEQQAHRDLCFRSSLKAHRKGKQHGFDHPGVQVEWLCYKAGWVAGRERAS